MPPVQPKLTLEDTALQSVMGFFLVTEGMHCSAPGAQSSVSIRNANLCVKSLVSILDKTGAAAGMAAPGSAQQMQCSALSASVSRFLQSEFPHLLELDTTGLRGVCRQASIPQSATIAEADARITEALRAHKGGVQVTARLRRWISSLQRLLHDAVEEPFRTRQLQLLTSQKAVLATALPKLGAVSERALSDHHIATQLDLAHFDAHCQKLRSDMCNAISVTENTGDILRAVVPQEFADVDRDLYRKDSKDAADELRNLVKSGRAHPRDEASPISSSVNGAVNSTGDSTYKQKSCSKRRRTSST